MNKRTYSIMEEISHAITHGIGALLSIAGLVLLVVFAAMKGTTWHVVSCAIYGGTLVILYMNSTLYHSLAKTRAEKVFQILDHSSIYLLIAGTYTPFTLVTLRGALGWTMFGVIWGLAVLGVIFKVFSAGRLKLLSTFLYLIMGWIIVFAIGKILHSLPTGGLVFLVIGGGLYTLGTVFYIFKKIPYFHFVWHLFVLAASIMHFFAIFFYIIPLKT